MQNKDIEMFLELVNTRNITKASENLYVTQSVISTRLKRLESELGYELFVRAKGMREIELTRAGREFVSVARRMRNLYEEAELLRENTSCVLRLACPESVYYDFLESLLLKIMEKHTELKLSVEMLDSSEVYNRMESGLIDFGFASYESTHSGILHSHILNQHSCLVMRDRGEKNPEPISPAELNPADEVRLTGGNFTNVSQWRDTWFPGADRCRVEVSSPHMVLKLVSELDKWAILPLATAGMLAEGAGVRIVELTDAPDSRKIYLLRHTLNRTEITDAVKIFEKELLLRLNENTNTGG